MVCSRGGRLGVTRDWDISVFSLCVGGSRIDIVYVLVELYVISARRATLVVDMI